MAKFRRILMASDLTPASAPALAEAVKLAKDNDAELLIAHVYRAPNQAEAAAVAPAVYEEWDENLRSSIERRLEPFVEDARRQMVKARALILKGAPYEAIAEAAQANGVDLVIMGTHGRSNVSRFFLGSVASRVIATAPCPVLTVRAA